MEKVIRISLNSKDYLTPANFKFFMITARLNQKPGAIEEATFLKMDESERFCR